MHYVQSFEDFRETRPQKQRKEIHNKPDNEKKVASLSELTSTDKDVEIEVEVISHNLREQSIRRAKADCLWNARG